MKIGDKVWVLCLVLEVENNSVLVCGNGNKSWWVRDEDCKPVEPEAVEQPISNPVNPSHYKQGPIECIEAIKAALGLGFVAYLWGNILKYLWRWPNKNGIEDLKKARWYLDRLIQEEEAK
jgi:hypothetical protein